VEAVAIGLGEGVVHGVIGGLTLSVCGAAQGVSQLLQGQSITFDIYYYCVALLDDGL
jgi:hypothetical protein